MSTTTALWPVKDSSGTQCSSRASDRTDGRPLHRMRPIAEIPCSPHVSSLFRSTIPPEGHEPHGQCTLRREGAIRLLLDKQQVLQVGGPARRNHHSAAEL